MCQLLCSSTIVCRREQQFVYILSLSFSPLCLLLRENDIHRRRSVYSCTTGRMNRWPHYVLCIMLCVCAHCCQLFFLSLRKKRTQHFALSLSLVCLFSFRYMHFESNYRDKRFIFRQVAIVNE